ncbi:DUF2510 domain-containing protein [Cellulomonas aerilata]|uniref:DUF2510 domain-containing protein n=1 Tax=Cellulomonas aerilata TaxID=515326 RepID=A0A512D9Q6_9CELL|nr:DUF2510 domain-containing protein [Cellulomonas aerilata]GEO33216.1 hypothetical protein CAE01nite_09410 [Cellulomonas aerilata]
MSDGTYPEGHSGGARVAPGWYPDPSGEAAERWWDGTGWTAQSREHSVLAQPLTRPAVLTNNLATAGLVLGVVALLVNTFLVVSIAALVLSVLGLNRAGQLVQAGYGPVGRGKAIAGIVLSLLGGAGTVLFKALLF